MDQYAYVFTRLNNHLYIHDEEAADRLMFKRSSWEAPDIRYLGRIPLKTLEGIYTDFAHTYQPQNVKNQGDISPHAEMQEIKERAKTTESLFEIIREALGKLNDKGEPRDFSVKNERGNIQTSQRVLGSLNV